MGSKFFSFRFPQIPFDTDFLQSFVRRCEYCKKTSLAAASPSNQGAACLNIILTLMLKTFPNNCIGLELISRIGWMGPYAT